MTYNVNKPTECYELTAAGGERSKYDNGTILHAIVDHWRSHERASERQMITGV